MFPFFASSLYSVPRLDVALPGPFSSNRRYTSANGIGIMPDYPYGVGDVSFAP